MKNFLKCLTCSDLSPNVVGLESHYKSHELSEIKRFSCHLCSLKFLKFSTLESHLQLVHLKKKLFQLNQNLAIRTIRKDVEEEFNKLAQPSDDDENHEDDCRDVEDQVDKSPQPSLLQKKTYACTIEGCSKIFQHLTSFTMHKKCVHSDERSFFCEICSKAFKTSSNLNVHIKMHNNQRDHKCTECAQAFYTSSHLKAHKKIHLNEFNYKCDVAGCEKSFIHLSSYKKHKTFHSGIKNHQCRVCLHTFSQACHLREHLKIHADERNHVCGTCNKAFRRPDTLRIHQRTHAVQSL